MADVAWTRLVKIIEVASEIKNIVDTIEHNKKECVGIERCVANVSLILQQFDKKKVTAAMRGPLECIAKSVDEALDLVYEWKNKNICFQFFGANSMKGKLDGVQKEIERNMLTSSFAMHVHSFLKNQELDAQVVNESLNPVWNQTFDFIVEDGLHDMLILEAYDHNTFGRGYMGRCILTSTKILQEDYKDSFNLVGANSGKLNLHLQWSPQPIMCDLRE